MKTELYTLPASWASALVNLDYSGLTDQEETNILHWLENNRLELNSCLECNDEAVLMKCYIKPGIMVYCECLEFTFSINE
jgi:hypothetical protein